MSNTIKKCTTCKGTGLVNKVNCPVCKGLGVPIYDEDYDNALSFMEEKEEDFIDEENE